ncbi:MAG: RyR domain-containing protein [Pseudomonadales bacterium]
MFERINLSTWFLIVFILLTLVFGFWGWSASANFADSLYRTIAALLISDTYQDSTGIWSWQIEVARWTGIAAFILGASKALLVFFSDALIRTKARSRSGHILVIGDALFAAAVVNAAQVKKHAVNWLAATGHNYNGIAERLFVQMGNWNLDQAHLYGLTRAKIAVVSFDDDAKSIAVARQLRAIVKDENQLQIFLSVNALWLAMRIDEFEGLTGVRVVSQSQAAVRRIHRRHPPFLVAKNYCQKNINSVIIGFGLWGESVLVDSLLSCSVSYLGRSRFTIIDPNADSIRKSLNMRYPELERCADFTYVSKMLSGAENCLEESDILTIGESGSVTACYVCLPDESESLSAALVLQAVANRAAWEMGPIFVRLSTPETLTPASIGVRKLVSAQLIGFGDMGALVEEASILAEDTDGLAKALHHAYRSTGSSGRLADVPWRLLSEDKRDANRRVAMHLPAKLSSTGVDIEPWLEQLDFKPSLGALPEVTKLITDDKMLEQLAELEHTRWMMDRRINGWSYAATRDDKRRFHPDLVPYDELSEQSKSYDRKVITTLGTALD